MAYRKIAAWPLAPYPVLLLPPAKPWPDLLLSQDYGDAYLLIEFKRPSHEISRDDIDQAEKYRDDTERKLSSGSRMEIMLVGAGRAASINPANLLPSVTIHSFESIISTARAELGGLISSLAHAADNAPA